MPNLNVYLVEGFAPERKTALLKRMTDAIVTTIGAPREAVRIFLIELARAHVCVGGVTLLEADLPGGPTVHALLVAGRSEAQKEALIGGLTRAIEETLDVPADDSGYCQHRLRHAGRHRPLARPLGCAALVQCSTKPVPG